MAKYVIKRYQGLKGYYAVVYSKSGKKLDSLVFATKAKAQASLRNLKKSGFYKKY
tara:strand:+ start:135 stop:299 length:165 start_codon:yes stop_codon:yes gene_type:complete